MNKNLLLLLSIFLSLLFSGCTNYYVFINEINDTNISNESTYSSLKIENLISGVNGSFVSISGDTMTGDLNMSNNSVFINGFTLKALEEKNINIGGSAMGIYQTGLSGFNLPHFILQSGGSSQASIILRSLMIADERVGFHNTSDATSCPAYMNEIGETLKIDCNTTTTGADLLVGDDLQVVGDVWIKDEFGEWRHMENELTHTANLMDDTTLDKTTISFTNNGTVSNLTITNDDNHELEFNINRKTYSSDDIYMSVELISGTNTSPQINYVTVQIIGDTPVLMAQNFYPSVDHVDISKVMVGSNGYIISWTPINIKIYEAIYSINERFEQQGCLYVEGYETMATSTTFNITNGEMICILKEIESTNTINLNSFFWIRNNGTFEWCNDFTCIDEYSDGTIFGNNLMNVVMGVVALNETTVGLVAVVQDYEGSTSKEYNSITEAEQDQYGVTNYFPPNTNIRNSFTPIAKVIIDTSGELKELASGEYYQFLAGKVTSGGGAPSSSSQLTEDEVESFIFDNDNTDNFNLSGYNITNVNTLRFNNIGCDTSQEGSICWNDEDFTLDIVTGDTQVIQVGRELSELGRNTEGKKVYNGQVVHLSGVSGDRAEFKLAIANDFYKSNMVGVVTKDCNNNAECPVTIFGKVRDMNTSIYSEGDMLYLSDTQAGNFTTTPPSFPNNIIWVATVVRVHQTEGIIFVYPRLNSANGVTFHDMGIVNNLIVAGNVNISGNITANNIRNVMRTESTLVNTSNSSNLIINKTFIDEKEDIQVMIISDTYIIMNITSDKYGSRLRCINTSGLIKVNWC